MGQQPRGIRNNNPGNLRHSPEKWLGEIQGSDAAFKTFSDPVYGLRAIAKLLLNYESRYGLNTISGLINRWAPTNENDTSAYISAVSQAAGVSAGQPIDVAAYLSLLIPAIVAHENGQQPYSDEQIAQAIAMVTGGDNAQTPSQLAPAPAVAPAPVLPPVSADVQTPGPVVGGTVGAPVPGNGALTVGGIVLSKKLCALIGGVLLLLFGPALGLHLTPEQQKSITDALMAYLVAQGAADFGAPLAALLRKYTEAPHA